MLDALKRLKSTLLPILRTPIQVGLAGGFLVALWTLLMPNLYRSEVRILPVEQRSGLSGAAGGAVAAAAAMGFALPISEGADASHVDILTSRWLRKKLLESKYQYTKRLLPWGGWTQVEGTLLGYLKARNVDEGIRLLKPLMSVSRDPKTKLLNVAVETASPELSQQIVQAATRGLEEFVKTKAVTKGGNRAVFAEKRLKEARETYDLSEATFRTFMERNKNYLASSDPGVRMQGVRLEAELKLRQQLVTMLAMSREQSLIEEKDDMPILNVLDAGDLPIEKTGPHRARFVLIGALMAGLLMLIGSNFAWIRTQLLSTGH